MKYLKEIRADTSMNQAEFAQAIGVSKSYLAKLESDHATPSFSFLKSIYKFTNGEIDMNKFFQ